MSETFIVRGDDGEEYGPVSLEEMREWVRENRAGLGTTVRTDETGSLWQPWQYYPELVALLAETRAVTLASNVVLAPMPQRMLALVVDVILAYILVTPILAVVLTIGMPDVLAAWHSTMELMLVTGKVAYTPPPLAQAVMVLIVEGGIVFYMAGFHAAHGRTPAKSILKIQVVDRNGQKPSFARALLRGLVLSLSLYFYGLPLLYAFISPQRRALHDLAAGTYVVEL